MLNYSSAEVKISPPNFDQRLGFVDLEYDNEEVVDFSTTDSSLKFTDKVLSDEAGNSLATVKYQVETAERAARPVPAPRRPTFATRIVNFFRAIGMSVMALFGGL